MAGHPVLERGFVGERCDEDMEAKMPLKVGISVGIEVEQLHLCKETLKFTLNPDADRV